MRRWTWATPGGERQIGPADPCGGSGRTGSGAGGSGVDVGQHTLQLSGFGLVAALCSHPVFGDSVDLLAQGCSCRSYIKAGCTVNAEIVIDRKKHVLALEEKYFQFSYDSVYVEIKKENGDYEKRFLKTGIFDGTYTEIVSGLDSLDRIKVTENK